MGVQKAEIGEVRDEHRPVVKLSNFSGIRVETAHFFIEDDIVLSRDNRGREKNKEKKCKGPLQLTFTPIPSW